MAAQDSLKVATIFGRTASGSATGVADVDQEELRFAATALLGPGYLLSMIDQTVNTSSFNVRQDTGSNLQLKIGSGTSKKDGYVLLGTVAGQGAYIVRLDATTKTITVPAADATNPARYGVYLFIDDTAYSGTASRAYAQVACIRGTPAVSPTTPGPLATYSAYVLLWEFQLAANATAVTNTILDAGTDRRAPSYMGGTKLKSWFAAWGQVPGGYVSAVVDQGSITGLVDLTSLTVTFTAVAGRRYKTTLKVDALSTVGTDDAQALITDASNAQVNMALSASSIASETTVVAMAIETFAGGSVTRKGRMQRASGSGTITAKATSTSPNFILVEDIGPA